MMLADPAAARVQVRSPKDVANLLMIEMGLLQQEVMRTVLLNTKNHVIASPVIYQGSANTRGHPRRRAVPRGGQAQRASP